MNALTRCSGWAGRQLYYCRKEQGGSCAGMPPVLQPSPVDMNRHKIFDSVQLNSSPTI
jgi:hypothetical protein